MDAAHVVRLARQSFMLRLPICAMTIGSAAFAAYWTGRAEIADATRATVALAIIALSLLPHVTFLRRLPEAFALLPSCSSTPGLRPWHFAGIALDVGTVIATIAVVGALASGAAA